MCAMSLPLGHTTGQKFSYKDTVLPSLVAHNLYLNLPTLTATNCVSMTVFQLNLGKTAMIGFLLLLVPEGNI